MKNLTITLAITILTICAAYANNTPVTIISNSEVKVVSPEGADYILTADYNLNNEVFSFNTTDDITLLQIYSKDGSLQYQLPVMANRVKINKNLFGPKGQYKLGFILEGQKKLHFTQVTIK